MARDNPNRNEDAEDLVRRFLSYIDRQNRSSERLSGNSERFNQGDGDVPWEDQRVEIPATQVARRTCSGCVGFACVRSWKNLRHIPQGESAIE